MDIHKTITTKTAQETAKAGEALATSLVSEKGIICLYGDLGSGKTTFAQGFAKGLGFTGRLLSPTFIIVRRYQNFSKSFAFYHIDLYRTKTSYDIENIGFSEITSQKNTYIVIEWAEKLGRLLPKDRIDIRFTTNTDDSHTIIIESTV
jgi:tRNA threonylcarbamoyladenosine biosynthesis protein TsaE